MLRLILADDEYMERLAMKKIIESKFANIYEIRTASSGTKAIEIAKEFKPHLIITDIKMPGCSGIDAVREIKKFNKDINVVFITAYDYFDYAKEAVSLSAEELLLKPVEVSTVIELIDRMTEKILSRLEQNERTQKIEDKFEQIERQFENEFIDSLGDLDIDSEKIEKNLDLMDVKFHSAIAATINFTLINEDERITPFQKSILTKRLIEKIRAAAKKDGITLIAGIKGVVAKCIFVLSNESDCNVEKYFQEAIALTMVDCNYGISDKITDLSMLADILYESGFMAFKGTSEYQDNYPYELEEALIVSLTKKDFDGALTTVKSIAHVFEKEYHSDKVFLREAQGLYTVIKRSVRGRFSNCINIYNNMGDRIEEVHNYESMITFFGRIFVYLEANCDTKSCKNQILIQGLCAYIQEHYNEDISLDQAAKYIGFSSFYFAKIMKEHLGMSYIDYVISIRMKKAKKLLDETDMNISEVSYLVGYEDPNYFTRVFKKSEGVTPRVYKNGIKQ